MTAEKFKVYHKIQVLQTTLNFANGVPSTSQTSGKHSHEEVNTAGTQLIILGRKTT